MRFYFVTDGQEGRSLLHLKTNSPPRSGTCSIYPIEGMTLKTLFNIKCSGWKDKDSPISFKVYIGKHVVQHSVVPILPPTYLPPGDPKKNHTYKLTVRIADKYGSFSEAFLVVRVSDHYVDGIRRGVSRIWLDLMKAVFADKRNELTPQRPFFFTSPFTPGKKYGRKS